MYILSFQGDNKAATLWKKGCPNYDKLKQLFTPNFETNKMKRTHLKIINQTKQPLKFYTNYTPNNVSFVITAIYAIFFSQIDQTIQNFTKVIWAQKLLFFSYVFSTTKQPHRGRKQMETPKSSTFRRISYKMV